MSWRDIVRKGSCGSEREKQQFEKKLFDKSGAKPDFLDLDKDGNKEESMKDAAKQAKEKEE
tara:strand:- start:9665 stop:9847 length:183 start_codon:yes stop_codon:yes gene_type:complete